MDRADYLILFLICIGMFFISCVTVKVCIEEETTWERFSA